jgi:hypothetical protein
MRPILAATREPAADAKPHPPATGDWLAWYASWEGMVDTTTSYTSLIWLLGMAIVLDHHTIYQNATVLFGLPD